MWQFSFALFMFLLIPFIYRCRRTLMAISLCIVIFALPRGKSSTSSLSSMTSVPFAKLIDLLLGAGFSATHWHRGHELYPQIPPPILHNAILRWLGLTCFIGAFVVVIAVLLPAYFAIAPCCCALLPSFIFFPPLWENAAIGEALFINLPSYIFSCARVFRFKWEWTAVQINLFRISMYEWSSDRT